MLKRINFPNPQKVQNLNYIEVASVEMFNKMFEELSKDEKQKLLTALTQKFSLPFSDKQEIPSAYSKKTKQVIRKKMNKNVTIAHENSADFIEWKNQNREAHLLDQYDIRSKNQSVNTRNTGSTLIVKKTTPKIDTAAENDQ